MFWLTFNEPSGKTPGKGEFIAINVTMVGDIKVRKGAHALGIEAPRMQIRNIRQIFTIMRRYALKCIRTGEGMPANVGKYALEKQTGGSYLGSSMPGTTIRFNKFQHGEGNYRGASGLWFGNDQDTGYFAGFEGVLMPYKQSWGTRYQDFIDDTARNHSLGVLSGELYNGVKGTESGKIQQAEMWIEAGPRGGIKGGFRKRSKDIDTTMTTIFTKPNYIKYVHDGKPGVAPRPFFRLATQKTEKKVAAVLRRNLKRFSFTQGQTENDAERVETDPDLLYNPMCVHATWGISLSETEFTDAEIEIDYGQMKKPSHKRSSKGHRGKKSEPRKSKWSGYKEALEGSRDDEWERLKRKRLGLG